MTTWILLITIMAAAGMPKSPAMVTIPANSKEHCESIYQQYKESRPDRVAYVYGQCLYVGEE